MEHFEILECLGSGTYGKIFKVKNLLENSKIQVLKQINIEGMNKSELDATLNECKVHGQCEHPHIIKCHHSFIERPYLYLVMEYAECGDLANLIATHRKKKLYFEEETVWDYFIQILEGVHFLHVERRILHRDIKAQNVFLDANLNIKIGDLGLGRILGPATCFANTTVGTPLYFSPEMCEEKSYNHKSDIWALGCLLYEQAALHPPFEANNQLALATKICNSTPDPLPPAFTDDLRTLVQSMLMKNPDERPSVEDILSYKPVRERRAAKKMFEVQNEMEDFYRAQNEEIIRERDGALRELGECKSSRDMAIESLRNARKEMRDLRERHQLEQEEAMAHVCAMQGRIEEMLESASLTQRRYNDQISEIGELRMENAMLRELLGANEHYRGTSSPHTDIDTKLAGTPSGETVSTPIPFHRGSPSSSKPLEGGIIPATGRKPGLQNVNESNAANTPSSTLLVKKPERKQHPPVTPTPTTNRQVKPAYHSSSKLNSDAPLFSPSSSSRRKGRPPQGEVSSSGTSRAEAANSRSSTRGNNPSSSVEKARKSHSSKKVPTKFPSSFFGLPWESGASFSVLYAWHRRPLKVASHSPSASPGKHREAAVIDVGRVWDHKRRFALRACGHSASKRTLVIIYKVRKGAKHPSPSSFPGSGHRVRHLKVRYAHSPDGDFNLIRVPKPSQIPSSDGSSLRFYVKVQLDTDSKPVAEAILAFESNNVDEVAIIPGSRSFFKIVDESIDASRECKVKTPRTSKRKTKTLKSIGKKTLPRAPKPLLSPALFHPCVVD